METDSFGANDGDYGQADESQQSGGAEEMTESAAPSAPAEEMLVDPSTLPPELQAHFKRMQSAFTKRMQGFSEKEKQASEAMDLVRRFNSDPNFQDQIYQQLHSQRGGNRATGGQGQPPAQQAQGDEPPAELIAAMTADCPPGMEWMIPYQAKMFWKANKSIMAPVVQRMEVQEKSAQHQQWTGLETEMDTQFPMWRESESEILDLARFLQSGDIRHPKYGNKLAVLYRALKGEAMGTANAANRLAGAARNRTSTGTNGGGQRQANISERVMQAKTPSEAFRIAAQAALAGDGA